MEIRAYQKHIRTSPRKLRLVADVVKTLPPDKALTQLQFMNKRAAGVLAKVLKQAISNAVTNSGLPKAGLQIRYIQIETGPVMKRWRAVSRGRARRILKRTSHIKILLEGEGEKKQMVAKKPAAKSNKGKSKVKNKPVAGRSSLVRSRKSQGIKTKSGKSKVEVKI